MTRPGIFFATLLASFAAYGHHSISAFYDYETPTQLEGMVTAIDWVNPHVRFTLETLDGHWTWVPGEIIKPYNWSLAR